MTSDSTDQRLWRDYCSAENAFYEQRMALLRDVEDLSSLIAAALVTPSQRGTALRLLEILPEEKIRVHLAALVKLASVSHSDITLVRSVIFKLDRSWIIDKIDSIALQVLVDGNEEEYRRTAELYALLDPNLLNVHLQRCAAHNDREIREIADDFATPAHDRKR